MAIENLESIFTYPYNNDLLMRKQKSIRRQLLARNSISYVDKRIAILSGSTTDDVKNILELFLLYAGIKPVFYQSEYNKFYEDAVWGNPELDEFKPEIIIIFTSMVNILNVPQLGDSAETVQEKLQAEAVRFNQVWEALRDRYHAVIIQNNMDMPYEEPLGSLGAVKDYGLSKFIEKLNMEMAVNDVRIKIEQVKMRISHSPNRGIIETGGISPWQTILTSNLSWMQSSTIRNMRSLG